MYLAIFIYRAVHEDLHDVIVRHRKQLMWIVQACSIPEKSESQPDYRDLLRCVLDFDAKFGKTPPSFNSMNEFAASGGTDHEWYAKGNSAIAEQIETLRELDKSLVESCTDLEVLVDSLKTEARTNYHRYAALKYLKIATTGADVGPANRRRQLKGFEDAKSFQRNLWALDLPGEASALAGPLHENVEHIYEDLATVFDSVDRDSRRIQLGFEHVDSRVIISKKMNRFIGIVGMSGDGKTTVLNTIAYNIASQGFNILYNSLEHSPEEIWEIMAFLHCNAYKEHFVLPSRHDWNLGKTGEQQYEGLVQMQDLHHMRSILVDIQQRKGVPGLIDCQEFTDWDSIVNHLDVNDKQNHYDVLIVDYLDHLETPGVEDKWADKARKEIIHKAQRLAANFKDRGLVIISPMQVNNEGYKRASEAEEGDQRYSKIAIRQFSEYMHDMDYIFSVYSSPEQKQHYEMEMGTVKNPRKGIAPLPAYLRLNKNTGYVCEMAKAGALNYEEQPTMETVIGVGLETL